MKKKLLVGLLFVALTACAKKADTTPHLNSDQKLALRNAQVALMQADAQLKNSQPYLTFEEAQKKLNQAVDDAYSAAKIDKKSYYINGDLEVVKQPDPPKAEAKK